MDNRPLAFDFEGNRVVATRREVHQWRTDVMLRVGGREFLIHRMESPLTRGEVRALAIQWLTDYRDRWR